MRLKKALAAAIGLSMVSTPVLAQSAAPLSVMASMSRAGAGMEEASGLEDEYLLPGLIIFAVLAAAILYTANDDSNSASP